MSEYDARGKPNRALLICVDTYEHLTDLPAVRDNAEELKRVLSAPATDLFTGDEIVICRPGSPGRRNRRWTPSPARRAVCCWCTSPATAGSARTAATSS